MLDINFRRHKITTLTIIMELQMKITATFSNGQTITRNTKKTLTHAYQATNKWQTFTGFAGSEELAKKAANYGNPHHIEIVNIKEVV